jgi:hypothetical protein
MTKFNLPKFPKLPKFNKTFFLVGAGALVFSGITAFGVVRNVQAERAESASVAAAQAREAAEDAAKDKLIASLQAEVKALQGDKTTVSVACAEFRRLDSNRAITFAIQVPAFCLNR